MQKVVNARCVEGVRVFSTDMQRNDLHYSHTRKYEFKELYSHNFF